MTTETTASPLTLPPLSLYVHIPWCVRKCPYCDFNSHTSDSIPEQAYVHALMQDLEQSLDSVQGRTLRSVFFGGGTPSLFSPQAIETILHAAHQLIGIAPDAEITLEANPGTTDQSRFEGYRAAGVNRLSIGVQSFDDTQLQTLGRIHNSDDAMAAVTAARSAGFDHLNIDLMHGLPQQTPEGAHSDLQRAIALDPGHISWYQLTIEPNTTFFTQPPTLPDDDQLSDIQIAGEALLADAGYSGYEISAFSRRRRESTHNTNYWLFGDYIGIGAGAHGKYTDLGQGSIRRQWQTRMPAHYLDPEREFVAGSRELTPGDLPLEFLMNALRLSRGFSQTLFEQRTGLPYATIAASIDKLVARELLTCDDQNIRTTALGKRFLNDLLNDI